MCNPNITVVMGGLIGAVMSLDNKKARETKEKDRTTESIDADI